MDEKKTKDKVRYVSIGSCPNCGKQYVRIPLIDATACLCKNPDAVLVPLQPALIVSKRTYAKLAKIAELAGVTVELLANEMLMEGAKQKLAETKAKGERVNMPEVVVTAKC